MFNSTLCSKLWSESLFCFPMVESPAVENTLSTGADDPGIDWISIATELNKRIGDLLIQPIVYVVCTSMALLSLFIYF